MADDGVIGKNNRMPWHIPEDLAYFKEQTTGHALIMGRNTLFSIGQALPNRTNVVLTRDPAFKMDGVITMHSLQEACLAFPDAFIIGGANVFSQALPLVSTLYITHIHAKIEGDTRFPHIELHDWHQRLVKCTNSQSGYELSFYIYERHEKMHDEA